MSIATEIQRLKTAKSDLKTAIEEKGVIVGDGLIDTYADKVREISVSKINEEYLVEEVVSGTGCVVAENVLGISHPIDVKLTSDTITDFSGITISRSGRNLVRYPYFDGNLTKEGVTFTDKGNGIVNISGEMNNEERVEYFFAREIPLKKGTYTLSANCDGNHNGTFTYYVYDMVQSKAISFVKCHNATNNVNTTFTIDKDVEKVYIKVLLASSNTTLNADVSVQLEYGTEASPFELFDDYSTHQVNADGTVDGLMSICPTTVLCADDDTVNISMAYYKNEGNGEETDDRYDEGYEDGKNSMPDYLQYVTATPFWQDVSFPENLRDVQLNFSSLTTLTGYRWFGGTNATSVTIIGGNIVKAIFSYSFHNCKYLKYVDFSKCGNGEKLSITHFANAFQGCELLERIIGNLDLSDSTANGNCFSGCTALKEFRVIPSSIKLNFSVVSSPNLSAETRQSIIDGLADLTGQTAQTLTVHKTVGEKLTEEQKATITAKNWILAY